MKIITNSFKLLITFLFFLIFAGAKPLCAQKQILPSIEPLFLVSDILHRSSDSSDYTNYSAQEIFEIGLLYSECKRNSGVWNNCYQKFEELKTQIDSPDIKNLSPQDQGRAILKLLYNDYLTTYSINQTRIDVALETGTYNCVSSAILYMIAAKLAGLEVRGQKTTQHAFCSVYIPTAQTNKYTKIDVETTNPYGFNPGSKEAIEKENEIKGYYIVPKTYYSNRQEVSDALFTGLIAGNVCSLYVDKNEYTDSIPLGAARYNAIINEKTKAAQEARKEFDILASNFVNILPADADSFSPYLKWYSSFIERWGITSFLQNNMDNAVNNMLVLCYEEKNYELAQETLENYQKYISPKHILNMQEMLVDILIASSTQELSMEQQIDFITDLLAHNENTLLSNSTSIKRLELHLENVWLSILNNLMNKHSYEQGYITCGTALDQLPKSSKIKSMQTVLYKNTIAQIHNNFADAANNQNYSQARQILESGLKKFPEDKTLKEDLKLLEHKR